MSTVSIKKESLGSIMRAASTDSKEAANDNVLLPKIKQTYSEFDQEIKQKRAVMLEAKSLANANVIAEKIAPSQFVLRMQTFMQWLLPPVFGLLLLLAVWALIAAQAQG